MTLPTKDQIHKFLADLGSSLTKREMIDAFHIKGDDRVPFKRILREMEDEGLLIKEGGKSYRVPDALPAVTVIEVTEIDIDGDVIAKPAEWNDELQGQAPRIEIINDGKGAFTMKVGDRALAQVRKFSKDLYEAKILKRMNTPKMTSVGLLKQIRGGYIVEPMERNAKFDFEIAEADFNGARPGEIVVCEIQPSRSALRKRVRVIEVIGTADDPKAISLVALHQAGLRMHFPDDVIDSTKDMQVPPINGREDLRKIPLVTIDGKDARDFDDAVFAEPDKDGFHLIVAIADVSYYVRSGSPLDKEAYLRGNSTYFPDRVVPMLPERLSNDLCSLRPHEPRATLAVHMWINEQGKLLRHKFVRGLMQSHARLTYEQVQAARDGITDATTEPLMKDVIEPLYTAWKVLDKAREKRGALDLDVPERKIVVDDKNEMTGVAVRERLDSHRLIEEFMILANVAAAEALENKKAPCVYRIHDRPSGDKLMSARSFLEAFGLSLPKEGVSNPGQINHILKKAKEMKTGFLINEVILRSQAQAVYDPENIGHFGLALERYAHFTSPIRRYADLIVHRSLIKAYDLGEGGLSDVETVKLVEIAEHISMTERASAEAERNSVDRFTASFLKDKIGAQFPGRIGGVTRFGLFVKLVETGSDGLVPIRTLPSDFYIHDESQHALIGRRTGRVFRLGAQVLVRLVEADPMTGSTLFELINGEDGADIEGYKARSSGYSRQPRPEKFRKEKGKTNRRGDGPNTPRNKKRDHKKKKRD
ncbi:MAG: ribonuclease R [Micavibrio aeruginosavorus]|uniref:Ribonuclease R n=1 Tax=Micavibrio aeruginosavorus TaxID=349221 RepID=A0A2W5FM70_9BACT|nr:MAG: ribonuclease R [Micavibrio aeruginosavorus]